jgi:hypothetical protein
VPDTADGSGFTVTDAVAMQPVGRVYVITVTPAEIPFTAPVSEPTVATEILLLDHEPPASALLNVVVEPTQTLVVPMLDGGRGLTVTVAIAVQPELTVYVTVPVPADTPVTAPTLVTGVESVVLELLHEPPGVASVKVIVEPTQTAGVPAIAAGEALTVIILFTIHPAPTVYVMLAVPAVMPVTIPSPEPTRAIATEPELHEPPVDELDKVIVLPVHTLPGPEIADGAGLTVTTAVVMQPVAGV